MGVMALEVLTASGDSTGAHCLTSRKDLQGSIALRSNGSFGISIEGPRGEAVRHGHLERTKPGRTCGLTNLVASRFKA
jgi:hypothetical protein